MSKQPEALRLADAIRLLHESKRYRPSGPGGQMCGSEQYQIVASGLLLEDIQNAAAELRRLHAINAELLEALCAIVDVDLTFFDGYVDRHLIRYSDVQNARATIAKARKQP